MIVPIETTRSFRCPACGVGSFHVEHVIVERITSAGPWFCDDCRLGWNVAFTDVGVNVTPATRKGEHLRHPQQWAVLRRGDLLLLVKTYRGEARDEDEDAGTRYYLEEGTCPVNYFNSTFAVAVIGDKCVDTDPHGAFTLVGCLPSKDDACRQHEEPDDWFRVALPPGDTRGAW